MALTQLWKNSQKELSDKHVRQVIQFAGDGKLKDGGPASAEFREFLSLIPSGFLEKYAGECLKEKFDDNGLALQDVINQVGKRLGFQVEQGRYRGTSDEVGFDGLWHSPDGNSIVVEVKTTDTYLIDLDRIASYRRKLVQQDKISEVKSSILLIVGRDDTGGLEAQVRGSRHAWDVRLISIDSLVRLMTLKEALEDPKIMEKIRRVLMPQEFTRVDGIIDLVFSTAEEVKIDDGLAEEEEESDEDDLGPKKPKFIPANFRDACAARVAKHLGQPLIKVSSATYSSPDERLAVICINSREYKKASHSGYWFAFHPYQRDVLEARETGYVALGCGSKDSILLIPAPDFLGWLNRCHTTEREDRFYWHIRVVKDKSGYLIQLKKGHKPVKLDQYFIRA